MATNSLKDMSVQLGQKIQKLREQRKLSQETLAEKLDISRTYIAYIETGSRTPSLKVLHNISNIFDVKMEDLFKF